MFEFTHPKSCSKAPIGLSAIALVAVAAFGLAACGDEVDDVRSFIEYVDATGDVLDANGLEAEFDIDCEGSTETDEVTCTATTTEGQIVESIGEDLGEETATLVVTVDGEVVYDGLLDDADSE